jgi:hypothetical protein
MAAFKLLFDIMLHGSVSWHYTMKQLQTEVYAAAGQFLPQQFNNMALQSLQAPG